VAVDAQTGAALASGFPDLRVASQALFVKNRLQLTVGLGVVAGDALGGRRSLLECCRIQYILFVLVPVMTVQAIEFAHVLSMRESHGILARMAECLAVIQQNLIWLSHQGGSQHQPRKGQVCHVFTERQRHNYPFDTSCPGSATGSETQLSGQKYPIDKKHDHVNKFGKGHRNQQNFR